MDKVLKQRLVGATILIALAVIFVPMLLVDPDRMEVDEAGPMDIPPMPESAREVRRIPLDPQLAREPEPEPERAPEPVFEPPRIEDEIVLRPSGAEESDPPPAIEAPSEVQTSAPVVAEAAEEPAATEPEPRPVVAEPAPAEPEPAPTSVAPATADAEVGMGSWLVQVASFGSAQAAAEVRERLERLGHIVLRDEIVRGDNTLTRLRTGPYPSREAAEQARQQIVATVRGVQPIVVAAEGEAGAPQAAGFAVQVGSFLGENNAVTETDRLRGLGFEAFRHAEQVGGRTVWKVLVGPVPARPEAEALRSRLVETAGVEGLVVSHP